jgi:hypothetical protein
MIDFTLSHGVLASGNLGKNGILVHAYLHEIRLQQYPASVSLE